MRIRISRGAVLFGGVLLALHCVVLLLGLFPRSKTTDAVVTVVVIIIIIWLFVGLVMAEYPARQDKDGKTESGKDVEGEKGNRNHDRHED